MPQTAVAKGMGVVGRRRRRTFTNTGMWQGPRRPQLHSVVPLHKIKQQFSGGSLNPAHLFTSVKSKREEEDQPSAWGTTVFPLSVPRANMCCLELVANMSNRSLLRIQVQNKATATTSQRLTRPVLGIDHTAATSAHAQSSRSACGGVGAGWRFKGRSAGLLPLARPRQQSSIPRAECLSDGSLLGSQPADHFISHYRPLSDLTRFPQLYAALAYNMCILLPSCQENPRSCPSRQRAVRVRRRCADVAALARLVSFISHVSLRALG